MSDDGPIRLRREPPAFRRARVRAVAERSPRLRAISLEGPELVGFAVEDPAASARLLVPRDGVLELPSWTGNEFLFDDSTRPPIRTITPLRADPAAGRLEVEVVLHGHGPLAQWARDATVGTEVAVSGPGKGYAVDPAASRHLLAGDESALPAIAELLEAIPAGADVHVIVDLAHLDGRLELPPHPKATVEWCDSSPGQAPHGRFVTAVTERSFTDDERIWVAGEAAVVQRIRKHLFEELGLPRTQAVVRGYWKRGRAEA